VQKTVGLAEPIRKALEPLARSIEGAFLYGSIARAEDTARSDIDLMVLSDDLSYADLYSRLEAPATALGRPVNPTVFTPAEWRKKLRDRNAFAKKVQAQPKIWLIGGENGEPS
jgi:predicted nucleotidyltransferase